jgi:PAS domain S-box-containing protein
MQNREDNSPKPAQSRPRGSTLFPKDFQGMQMTPHAIEQFHRVLFGNLLEGIVTIDKDSIITYINDIAAGSCGYEAHEMIGKPVHDFISLEELEKVSELSKKSSGKEIEFTYRKRDGTDIYLYIKVGIVSE